MSACVTYIAHITQVTLEVINYTLFIYDRWLFFFHIQFLFQFFTNLWVNETFDGRVNEVYGVLQARECCDQVFVPVIQRHNLNPPPRRVVSWPYLFNTWSALPLDHDRCINRVPGHGQGIPLRNRMVIQDNPSVQSTVRVLLNKN